MARKIKEGVSAIKLRGWHSGRDLGLDSWSG